MAWSTSAWSGVPDGGEWGMHRATDARRRWFGLLFLILAAGMTTWGLIFLGEQLRGLLFVAYWLVCFGCLLLAMAVAVVDFFIMRRRQREERSRLAERAIRETASAIEARARGRKSRPRTKSRKKPGAGAGGDAPDRSADLDSGGERQDGEASAKQRNSR